MNPVIIQWYYSFLTDRTQRVKVNDSLSQVKYCSTGVPQGCVSSPVLFTLYTNECSNRHPQNCILKYSDDTAILSLLKKQDSSSIYYSEISSFIDWCDVNFLKVNTKKTEEIIFDPKGIGDHMPVFVHNQEIAQVKSCKYLGVYIDKSLTWDTHAHCVC